MRVSADIERKNLSQKDLSQQDLSQEGLSRENLGRDAARPPAFEIAMPRFVFPAAIILFGALFALAPYWAASSDTG